MASIFFQKQSLRFKSRNEPLQNQQQQILGSEIFWLVVDPQQIKKPLQKNKIK